MINVDKITYNEPMYYVPSDNTPRRVMILSVENDTALVKPYSKKTKYAEYTIPIKYVFLTSRDAKRHYKTWKAWKKRRKQLRREAWEKKQEPDRDDTHQKGETST